MSMSSVMILGDILLAKGYRVRFDENTDGYIYIGFAKSGSKITEAKWCIVRIKITDSGKTTDYEWSDAEPLIFNKIWNSRKNGTYTYDFD